MDWLRRVVGGVVVVVIPFTASAWEADGFRSGMTLAEAMAVVVSRGEGTIHRAEVAGGPKNSYSVILKSKSGAYGYKLRSGELQSGLLTFCSDVLFGYDRLLPGGFEAFVTNTEREARRLGAPVLEAHSVNMSIIASWTMGNDRQSFSVDKLEFQFNFSRSYENVSRCPDR